MRASASAQPTEEKKEEGFMKSEHFCDGTCRYGVGLPGNENEECIF